METNSGIVLRKMNSANVRLDNSGDPGRVYDVAADVNVGDGDITSSDGSVARDGFQIAGFSCYGPSDDNLSINYQNVPASQQCRGSLRPLAPSWAPRRRSPVSEAIQTYRTIKTKTKKKTKTYKTNRQT